MMVRIGLATCMILLIGCAHQNPVGEEDIARLKDGVVKVTAKANGMTKVGTGFIVRIEENVAYIVTASHVIEGDPQPKVVFRGQESKSFPAQVKGLKGGDPRGLAVLVVLGNVPSGLIALPVNSEFESNGGEEVTVIGFPLVPAVPWAVTPGMLTGQQGEYLVFSGAAAEGNSGGPVLRKGQVVGVVTQVLLSSYGYAVPIPILRVALRGWGVSIEATPSVAKRLSEENGENGQQSREIIGKASGPMVLVPAGEFLMGSQDEEGQKDEHPRHRVALTAFFLDKYEVTNRLFQHFVHQTGHQTTAEQQGRAKALVEGKSWEYVKGASWRKPEAGTTVFDSNRAEHPVVSVSWDDAQAYCRWLGKRLPTEAEFEYATRAGTETEYWWGNGSPGLRRVANIADESAKRQYSDWPIMTGYDDGYVRTAPVGSFEANSFGLYDMTGNVFEWTADWYDEQYYSVSPQRDPKGPSDGEERVIRGGSWKCSPNCVRSAFRFKGVPTSRSTYSATSYLGFRCAQDAK